MSDCDVSYDEFKFALLSDCYDAIDNRENSVAEAVTNLLDDVSRSMWESRCQAVCATVTASIICLREGFLLDFLEDPAKNLDDITDLLKGQELLCYRDDMATLSALLTRTSHTIVEADYDPQYFVS